MSRIAIAALVLMAVPTRAAADDSLGTAIDAIVEKTMKQSAVPGAWVAVNANAFFTEQALRDFKASLADLGDPPPFAQLSQYDRGGMTYRDYRITLRKKTLIVNLRQLPDGKLEQYLVVPAQ